MKKSSLLLLSIIFSLMTFNLWAKGEVTVYKRPDINSLQSFFNPLNFFNRAACAKESKTPSRSALFLLDNVNLGRTLYRVAQNQNLNKNEFVRSGIYHYRKTFLWVAKLIHQRLQSGRLPLLTSDLNEDDDLKIYHQINKSCMLDQNCTSLDQYISKFWSSTTNFTGYEKQHLALFKTIDNFSKKDFLDAHLKQKGELKWHCHRLHKFSKVNGQLFATKLESLELGQIVADLQDLEQNLTTCEESLAEIDNLKNAVYQIELETNEEDKWEDLGFDYWHSFKLYLRYALKHSDHHASISGIYHHIFKEINLEDSLLMIPLGCENITKPKCDQESLSLNSIRELAKNTLDQLDPKLDYLQPLSLGPEDQMLLTPTPDVNTDILNLSQELNADIWASKFKEKLSTKGSLLKQDLLSAISFYQILSSKVNFARYSKDLALNIEEKLKVKDDEIHYLCREFAAYDTSGASLIKNELSLLKTKNYLDSLTTDLVKMETSEFLSLFEKLASFVNTLCTQPKLNKYYASKETPKPEGFFPWYIKKFSLNAKSDLALSLDKAFSAGKEPYLYFNFADFLTPGLAEDKDVLCFSPISCARNSLKHIINIYHALEYSKAFVALGDSIKSPALFNPYTERTACGVYDPWYKTKYTIVNFFSNLTQAAISTFTPGLVYTQFHLEPKQVLSMKQLIDEGKIEYDVNYSKQKIKTELVASLGPLLGIPCSVSISNFDSKAMHMYQFGGVSLSQCHQNSKHKLFVSSSGEITPNEPASYSQCFSCSLNFETVTLLSNNPVLAKAGPVYYLIRAFVGLIKGFRDNVNVPKSQEVDLYYLLESYRKFGEINKECIKRLRDGKVCQKDACENFYVKMFRQLDIYNVEKIDHSKYFTAKNPHNYNEVHVSQRGCKSPTIIETNGTCFDVVNVRKAKDCAP
jgi:hypothetical protein